MRVWLHGNNVCFKMATMIKLLGKKNEITKEHYERINDAESHRAEEFKAAHLVQAWYRGVKTRTYLKHLHASATCIQKRWRGYKGRERGREVLKQHVFIMKLNHYNRLATLIQKSWRGYYTRKYVFNYYSRKRYLEALQIKNEIIRNELDSYAEQQEMKEQMRAEKLKKEKEDIWARKNHYLLSTQQIPGIYNSPYRYHPDIREYHLRDHKPTAEDEPKKKSKVVFDPPWKSYDLPRLSPLPPLEPKPQGPFRQPSEVQKQRYKPFQPSLRVATNYYSLDEAQLQMKAEEFITRLNDNTFLPCTKVTKEYDPLLHTRSGYGHLPYGNKYFREEFRDKFIAPNNFKSVVPPIPILEKLNDTYSQGQV